MTADLPPAYVCGFDDPSVPGGFVAIDCYHTDPETGEVIYDVPPYVPQINTDPCYRQDPECYTTPAPPTSPTDLPTTAAPTTSVIVPTPEAPAPVTTQPRPQVTHVPIGAVDAGDGSMAARSWTDMFRRVIALILAMFLPSE